LKPYERLLHYVSIDTTSNPTSGDHPSTPNQKLLASQLVIEMRDLGLFDVYMDEASYVYGTIPATCPHAITVGFIAHLDTSCDVSGKDIHPQCHPNYQGEDIILNHQENIILKQSMFPALKNEFGRTLITTDGTTLLGADDKAGIAEIMSMAEYFMNNPSIPHGTIKIAFTPDEEIGEGADLFDIKSFDCDFAFTVDGGDEGEISYENFNAASADVKFYGSNIHPGSAKGKMVNSIHLAMAFHQGLPHDETPEMTEGYEGFQHLNTTTGTVEETHLHYIIRNHNRIKFESQKNRFIELQDAMNQQYGYRVCEVTLKDTYYNMFEKMKGHLNIIDIAIRANKKVGITPKIIPIRGGTDGARLTYEGLLCPNIATGGYNFHGKYECISIEAMDHCTDVLIQMVHEIYKEKM